MKKKLADKLVGECIENIDGNEMIYNETLDATSSDAILLNNYTKKCNSCTIYIVLFAVFFITFICIRSVFIYFHLYFKKDNIRVEFNPGIEATIY